jgi:hypothetical protein
MIKFVIILTSVVSINFAVSFQNTDLSTSQEDVELIFSEEMIGVESGQPVYPNNTKVWFSNNNINLDEVTVFVNEDEATIASKEKIDLSKITKLESGTYTLVVNAGQERTFGFTIQ